MVDLCTWDTLLCIYLHLDWSHLFLYRAFGNTAVLASLWDCRCSFIVLCSLCALVSSSFSCWHSLATVVDWDLIASTLLCNDASIFVRASGAVLQPSPVSSVTFNSLVRSATNKPCIICVCVYLYGYICWIRISVFLDHDMFRSEPWSVDAAIYFERNSPGGGGGGGGL